MPHKKGFLRNEGGQSRRKGFVLPSFVRESIAEQRWGLCFLLAAGHWTHLSGEQEGGGR